MVFGQGAGQPASQTMCIKTLGEARRGLAISTYYFFVDLNQTAAPLIGGLIAAAAPCSRPSWLRCCCGRASGKRSKKRAEKTPENILFGGE